MTNTSAIKLIVAASRKAVAEGYGIATGNYMRWRGYLNGSKKNQEHHATGELESMDPLFAWHLADKGWLVDNSKRPYIGESGGSNDWGYRDVAKAISAKFGVEWATGFEHGFEDGAVYWTAAKRRSWEPTHPEYVRGVRAAIKVRRQLRDVLQP